MLIIMPTEADGKFDPTKTMIGSGPWLFDGYTPSVSYKMKKNPDWYEKGFPLMDAVEVSIIPEYATRLAQLLAGDVAAVEDPRREDLRLQLTDELARVVGVEDHQLLGREGPAGAHVLQEPDEGLVAPGLGEGPAAGEPARLLDVPGGQGDEGGGLGRRGGEAPGSKKKGEGACGARDSHGWLRG